MYQSWMHPLLYMPASRPVDKLLPIINNQRPGLGIWRVAVCTEDSITEAQIPEAITNIAKVLANMDPTSPVATFVRVRNVEVLKQIIDLSGVEMLQGFIIPKAGPENFYKYADLVRARSFKLMPILESREIRDPDYRSSLLDVLSEPVYRPMIDCVRLGGNDLMGHLAIRRSTNRLTIYNTPVGTLIDQLVNEFSGLGGFNVTAPVFEGFAPKNDLLFMQEVMQHVSNGLLGQTVIHLRHMRLLRDRYKVSREDLASAQSILEAEQAVIGKFGRMDEPATHAAWAAHIIERHELFGDDETSQTLHELCCDI